MAATKRTRQLEGLAAILAAAAAVAPCAAGQQVNTRISERRVWHAANGDSAAHPEHGSMSVSADGRWIAFDSKATNLLPDDGNPVSDIFLYEVATGRTICITTGKGSLWANGDSCDPALSADGRFVVFTSAADNLLLDSTGYPTRDQNGADDVFLHDRDADGNGTFDDNPDPYSALTRVSVDSGWNEVRGNSSLPTISANGRRVLFLSESPDLVADDYNRSPDAFLRDLDFQTTERVDVDYDGNEAVWGCDACDLSADGFVVAFQSASDNLVDDDYNGLPDIFVRDLWNVGTERVSINSGGWEADGDSVLQPHCLSSDGYVVTFSSVATNLDYDDNAGRDVFVHTRWSGATTLVSRDSNGVQADNDCFAASISADGTRVVFSSSANNLVSNDYNGTGDVFLRDLNAGTTVAVSVGIHGGTARLPSAGNTIRADGNVVVFASLSDELVTEDIAGSRNVFFSDLTSGVVKVVSALAPGEANDKSSWERIVALSADQRYVAFSSHASNLVEGDTNGNADVFVMERATGAIVRVSVASGGGEADLYSFAPAISADGRFVAFHSYATNLIASDTNSYPDVFRHDRDPDGNGIFDEGNGITILVSANSSGVHGNDYSLSPTISADGNRIAFQSNCTNFDPIDTVRFSDIYVRDVAAGTTQLVTYDRVNDVGSNSDSYWAVISANGNAVAFSSYATNLLGPGSGNHGSQIAYVAWLDTGDLWCSAGDPTDFAWSYTTAGCLSADGRSVVVPYIDATGNYPDIAYVHFTYDPAVGHVAEWIPLGAGGFSRLGPAAMSSDGRHVCVGTTLSLVPWDYTYGSYDLYLREVGREDDGSLAVVGAPALVSSRPDGAPANQPPDGSMAVSNDGNLVIFGSIADDIVSGDTAGFLDVFLFDRTRVARWSNYGVGFTGTHGIPALTLSANPILGSTVDLDLGNSLGATTIALLFAAVAPAEIPLSWGATFLVDPALSFKLGLTVPAAGLALPGDIPDDESLNGLSLFFQALELDPGAPHKLAFTPGLDCHFGR